MLPWKPACSKGAVLAVQMAQAKWPDTFDYKHVYYYVTPEDIANELGRPHEDIDRDEIHRLFRDLGIDPSKNVTSITIEGENTYGYFVGENALREAGVQVEWPKPRGWASTAGQSRGSHRR